MVCCAKPKCQKELPAGHYQCKCGAAFCSEACFISFWHAGHQKECPNAAEITKIMADKAGGAKGMLKNGTKLLTAAALTKVLAKGSEETMGEISRDEVLPGSGDEAPVATATSMMPDTQTLEKLTQVEKAAEKLRQECSDFKERLACTEAARDKAASELQDAQSREQQYLRDAERLEKQLAAVKKEAAAGTEGVDVKFLEAEIDKLRDKSTDLWRDFAGERAMNNDLRDELTEAKRTLREAEDQARRSSDKARVLDEKLQEESEQCQRQFSGSEAAELQSALEDSTSECKSLRAKMEVAIEEEENVSSLARQSERAAQESSEKFQEALESTSEAEQEARREAEQGQRKGQRLERECEDLQEQLATAAGALEASEQEMAAFRSSELEARKLWRRSERQASEELEDRQLAQEAQESRSSEMLQKADEEQRRLNSEVAALSEALEASRRAEIMISEDVASQQATGEAHQRLGEEHTRLQKALKEAEAAETEAWALVEQRKSHNEELVQRCEREQEAVAASDALRADAVTEITELVERATELQAECRQRSHEVETMAAAAANSSELTDELRERRTSLEASSEDLQSKLTLVQSLKNQVHEELSASTEREESLLRECHELAAEVVVANQAEKERGVVAEEAVRMQQKHDALSDECHQLKTFLADAHQGASAAEAASREQQERLAAEHGEAQRRLGAELEEAQEEAVLARLAHEGARGEAGEYRAGAQAATRERDIFADELREAQGLHEEIAAIRSAQDEAGCRVAGLEAELERERESCSKWRTLIITEQDRSSDLQQQLMDAGKARHEALRTEAAKHREVERLQRQLTALQTGSSQGSGPAPVNGSADADAEIRRLQDQVDAVREEEACQRQAAEDLHERFRREEQGRTEWRQRSEELLEECAQLRQAGEASGPTATGSPPKTGYNWWWK